MPKRKAQANRNGDVTNKAFAVREWQVADLPDMTRIWNQVVKAANAFPQTDPLGTDEARGFFESQSFTGVAEEDGRVVGLYILHPNNVGRCAHIANASYAVDADERGGGIGRALVTDSLSQAGRLGFTGLQFNAVVASNAGAIHLYEQLGFTRVGTIPHGFKNGHDVLEDIIIFYHETP